MGLFFNKGKGMVVYAPFDGEVIAIESLKDKTFADKVMGDGIALIPTSETVVSPVKGVVSSLLDTKHAYGITASDGYDLLIHVGQDTVEMKGEGFEYFVNSDEKVNVGKELGSFNIKLIKEKGFETSTPIILIDGDFVISEKTTAKTVKKGDMLFTVKKK